MAPIRILLDEQVAVATAGALRDRGIDTLHVLEADLGGTPDPELIRWCQSEGRVLVTRNYKDFAPLVEVMNRRAEDFPGVLLLLSSIPWSDLAAHVRAVERWIDRRVEGASDVARG